MADKGHSQAVLSLMQRAALFGVAYAAAFVLVEGILAPLTRWGEYLLAVPRLFHTPLPLVLAWFCLASLAAGVVAGLADLGFPHWPSVLICSLTMALIIWVGEGIGAAFGWWSYVPREWSLAGVPLWVPASYGLAFSAATFLVRYPLGGAAQAVLVGIAWQVLSRVMP